MFLILTRTTISFHRVLTTVLTASKRASAKYFRLKIKQRLIKN